eukprot:188808-Rhodomonas_salina.1
MTLPTQIDCLRSIEWLRSGARDVMPCGPEAWNAACRDVACVCAFFSRAAGRGGGFGGLLWCDVT